MPGMDWIESDSDWIGIAIVVWLFKLVGCWLVDAGGVAIVHAV